LPCWSISPETGKTKTGWGALSHTVQIWYSYPKSLGDVGGKYQHEWVTFPGEVGRRAQPSQNMPRLRDFAWQIQASTMRADEAAWVRWYQLWPTHDNLILWNHVIQLMSPKPPRKTLRWSLCDECTVTYSSIGQKIDLSRAKIKVYPIFCAISYNLQYRVCSSFNPVLHKLVRLVKRDDHADSLVHQSSFAFCWSIFILFPYCLIMQSLR
jgi:hypothetical protein